MISICNGQDSTAFHIAIVADGDNDYYRNYVQEVISTIKAQGKDEYAFREEQIVFSAWDPGQVAYNIDKCRQNNQVDAILGLGPLSSNEIAKIDTPDKLYIAFDIIDPLAQEIGKKESIPHQNKLQFLQSNLSIPGDIELMEKEITSSVFALVISEKAKTAMPWFSEYVRQCNSGSALKARIVTINEETGIYSQVLPGGADAAYIAMIEDLGVIETDKLYRQLTSAHIKTFAHAAYHLENGALAAAKNKEQNDIKKKATRAYQMIENYKVYGFVTNEPLAEKSEKEIVINRETARSLGVFQSKNQPTNFKNEGNKQVIKLREVINLALENNHHRKIADEYDQPKDAIELKEAYAAFLPEIDNSFGFGFMDADRAATGFGATPQRTVFFRHEISQVIYSGNLIANLRFQKNNQQNQLHQQQKLQLDVIHEAAVAYIGLMHIQHIESLYDQINGEFERGYKLVQKQIESQERPETDIYRLESFSAHLKANSKGYYNETILAQVNINQLMGQRIDRELIPADMLNSDSSFLMEHKTIKLLQTEEKNIFQLSRKFMLSAENTIAEVQELDYEINRSMEEHKQKKRNLIIPEVSLKGYFEWWPARGGAGNDVVDYSQIPNDYNFLSNVLPAWPDNRIFNFRLAATLPLNAKNYLDWEKQELEIKRLMLEKAIVNEKLEEKITTALAELKEKTDQYKAYKAALKPALLYYDNTLVDYKSGKAGIVQITDALQIIHETRLQIAGARYSMLIALLNLERTTGQFSFYRL